jgi:hypothetical protein
MSVKAEEAHNDCENVIADGLLCTGEGLVFRLNREGTSEAFDEIYVMAINTAISINLINPSLLPEGLIQSITRLRSDAHDRVGGFCMDSRSPNHRYRRNETPRNEQDRKEQIGLVHELSHRVAVGEGAVDRRGVDAHQVDNGEGTAVRHR